MCGGNCVSYVWAGDIEALADSLYNFYHKNDEKKEEAKKEKGSRAGGKFDFTVRYSRLSECLNLYKKAQAQYTILCGPAHSNTVAAQNKWHTVQHEINRVAKERRATSARPGLKRDNSIR